MKNKLIIFDCFGVIFNEVAPVFLRKYLSEEEATNIKDSIFTPADLGEIDCDGLMKSLSAATGADIDEVIREWNKLFILRQETVDAIKEFGHRADIALLSNAPLGVVESLLTKHNLEGLFDFTVISCNVKMAKPDPEIYKYCLSQSGKVYDEIYMVDDNLSNLEPLERLGIIPVHFKGIDSLKGINV